MPVENVSSGCSRSRAGRGLSQPPDVSPLGFPMNMTLHDLIRRLNERLCRSTKVIPWSCPVPSFGDVSASVIATLGLNPSNREFMDQSGKELDASSRRLHTLSSLGLSKWSDVDATHVTLIAAACREYFSRNPYNAWFRVLDDVMSGAGVSYYGGSYRACHLDLIPYATKCKWTDLTIRERASLLAVGGNTLAVLLRDSSIRVLILNGRTVAAHLQKVANVDFEMTEMRNWTLPRKSGSGVVGVAFRGTLTQLCGVDLQRSIVVLGYNHNLQSSFGVTTSVKKAIAKWVSAEASEVIL
jgi:hypothetical protein